MMILKALLFGLSIFIVVFIVLNLITKMLSKKKEDENLQRIKRHRDYLEDDIIEDIKNESNTNSLYEKVFKPQIEKQKSGYEKVVKQFGIDRVKIQKKILRVGADNVTVDEIIFYRIFGFVVCLVSFLPSLMLLGELGLILPPVLLVYVGFNTESKLDADFAKKRDSILIEMPTFLKLMADATSSGNTVQAAITKVTRKFPGYLSDEFRKVEKEASFTGDWDMALENMSVRNDIEELTNLVIELKISKEKGIAITETLLRFAEKMEKEKNFIITEKARNKTTTMLVPMMMFLFGPLFLLILLPILTTILNNF